MNNKVLERRVEEYNKFIKNGLCKGIPQRLRKSSPFMNYMLYEIRIGVICEGNGYFELENEYLRMMYADGELEANEFDKCLDKNNLALKSYFYRIRIGTYEGQLTQEKIKLRRSLFYMMETLINKFGYKPNLIEENQKWFTFETELNNLNLIEIICLRYKIAHDIHEGKSFLDVINNILSKCINGEKLVDKYKIIYPIEDTLDINNFEYADYYDEGWEEWLSFGI